MALKFMLKDLEGLDENIAALYVKHDDGNFYLDVTGAVSKSKLDEFRNNNIELKSQMEQFKDVDPKKYKELLEKEEQFDKIDATTEEKVKSQVADRVKKMQEDFDSKLNEANKQLTTQSRQLEGLLIDSAVRKSATDTKVLPSAVDDVLLRARSVFKVVDGVATAEDGEGNVVYGKNGSDPLTINEWVGGLSKEAPHLFEQSAGGGSQGGRGGRGGQQDMSKLSPLQKISAGLEQTN